MGIAQKIMGHQHGHADDHSGGLIMKPRLYERTAAAWFFGLRKRRYDQLVALAGVGPGDRVLDIGCGTGYLSRRAALVTGPTGTVLGVDPSAPVVEFARGAAPSWCRFAVTTGDAVDEPDASFDVAISSLAIHHIPPAQRVATLREMRRLLRPGGRLLVADFRPPRSGVARHLVGALSGHAMQHNPIHLLPGLVAEAGFRVTGTGDLWPFLSYVAAVQPDSENRTPDRQAETQATV